MALKWIAILVGLALVAVGAYVRFAPSDPEVWHQMPGAVTDRDLPKGAMRIVGAGDDGLARLDAIIRDAPRTRLLAGSVEEGMMTYVTRSKLWGFPDYTTVRAAGNQIELYGRLRFGGSDFGVNADRLDEWLRRFAEGG